MDGPEDLEPSLQAAVKPLRGSSHRAALTLMVGTLFSRLSGLVKQSLLNLLFPREVTDAFLTAFRVPNLFRELLAEGALTNSFIPVYKGLSEAEARHFSGALLGLLLVVNGLLLALAYLAAPWLAQLLISDPSKVNVGLTTELIRVIFPFLPAMSLSALIMGILNAEERFFAPAWAPVALNIVTVALMAVFPGQALMLALAHVLGGFAQLLVQLPTLWRTGLWPRLSGLWHPALSQALLLTVPFAFTTGGRQVLNVVTSNVVTGISEGAPTAFANADLFLSLLLGLFSISPALAYYSRLSEHAARDPDAFAPTLLEGLRFITFLSVPAGLLLLLFGEHAVQLVFNWRSLFGLGLDPLRLELSVAATIPLGLAVFPIGLFNLLIRTFYVRRNVRTPILLVLGFLSFQALLYLLLARPLGIAGLSWATVIVAWLQLAFTLRLVARREGLELSPYLRGAGRIWLAGALATLVTLLALLVLPWPASWWRYPLQGAVGGGVFVGVYALLCLVFGVEELRRLARRVRPRR